MPRRRAPAKLPPAPDNDVARLVDRTDAEVRLQDIERRLDRWVNYQTGLGTIEDKTRAARFEPPWRLGDVEITSLASGNDLAAKCIEKRPDEMFRRGYTLEGQQPGAVDKSKIDDCVSYGQEQLQADVRLHEAMVYGRQYGGCLCLLGINDGREPHEPVDEEHIKSIDFINVVDRRFGYVLSYYSDYQKPGFGTAQHYLVANGVATSSYASADGSRFGYRTRTPDQIRRSNPQATILTVHETRLIRFDGITPDLITRQTLAGWSWSVLQRPYEILRMCDGSFDALAYLISDASQGVLKLKGLFNAISAGKEEKLRDRLKVMEETRSVMRSIALDSGADEDFTRVTTPLTGIPDAIDRIMQRVAAAMDMPVTELFGISPAGLNATGESDRIKWYDTIASEQKKYLEPKLKRLYRLISLAEDGPFKGKGADWKIKFAPLYAPTDKELADTRFANAQRDNLYIQAEVVTPQQVALTVTDVYPSIDADEIESEIEDKTKFDPFENDPLASAKGQVAAGGANGSIPEGQAPSVPLANSQMYGSRGATAGEGEGTPGDPNTGNPKAPLGPRPPTGTGKPAPAAKTANTKHTIEIKVAPAAAKKDAQSPRQAVYEQLSEDYGPPALSWVTDDAVQWAGPMRVDPARIDYSGKGRWAASREHAKVGAFRERIEKGEPEKPIVLVKTPGKGLLDIADGHHRGLAYRLSRKPALAFVARVPSKTGPWDEMHSQQHEGIYESRQLPRRDFSDDEPRAANGQWTSGGGAAVTSASLQAAANYRKQTDPRFKALKHLSGFLRSVPRQFGKAVVDEVKEKIRDAKGAASGVKHFLEGNPVSHEEKTAIKHVALTIAAGIVAGHLTPLLHVSGLVGESAGEFTEKVVEQFTHHFVEKFAKRAFRLDALAAGSDPHEWLADAILQTLADALDALHDEMPVDKTDAYDPDQERDERGRWTSGGGGGGGEATPKQPFNTYSPKLGAHPDVEEELELEKEQETDEAYYANLENKHGIHEANAETFHAAFEHAFSGPNAEFTHFVSHYTPEELGHMTTLLTHDGKAGIAIKDHGDGRIEGTALFNAGGAKGAGADLLKRAIALHGVNYLECYGEGLRKLYESVGFHVESKSAFNPEYAAPGWNYEKHGRPNYYTLRLG